MVRLTRDVEKKPAVSSENWIKAEIARDLAFPSNERIASMESFPAGSFKGFINKLKTISEQEANITQIENSRLIERNSSQAGMLSAKKNETQFGQKAANQSNPEPYCDLMSLLNDVTGKKSNASNNQFAGLNMGESGKSVRQLQKALIEWNSDLKKTVRIDGIYGPKTRDAVLSFKKANNTGKDGASIDSITAQALSQAVKNEPSPKPAKINSFEDIGLLDKTSDKYNDLMNRLESLTPYDYSPLALRIMNVAEKSPEDIVSYQAHRLKAETAARFIQLENEVKNRFPGVKLLITSTMDGRHMDHSHYEGDSIDFVLTDSEYIPISVSSERSKAVESLCSMCGFKPYNEYILDSRYKTGPHMHITRKK